LITALFCFPHSVFKTHRLIKTLITYFLFFAGIIAIAQNQRAISGVVLDKRTGAPVIGAVLFIKGTKQGAVTNINGIFNYTIKREDIENTFLTVSFLGYKTQEIRVGSKSNFTVFLEEDIESLDAVVITSSYGTKKLREEVVGSIVSIKPKDIAIEQPATSIDELLQGQVAGVLIETNPNLGEPVSINIRGQGSLTPLNGASVGTSTQPLIIVDGIILSEELGIDGSALFDAGTGSLSENFLNPLTRVGIQDIESIEILKDAAAVGLYGANAANGVILITTARGKKGKTQYNASVQGGVSLAFDQIKYMSGEQYNELRNLYHTNNGAVDNLRPWNGINTDWFELLNQKGSFTRYTAGASGGGELFRFRGSVSYQQREESQIGNSFDNLNSSFSANYIGKKLKAGISFSPSLSTKNNPNTLYNFAVDPTIPVRDENGALTPFDTFGNPLAVAQQNKSESQTLAFLTSIQLSYQFNDHLKLATLLGTDFSNKDEDRFFSGLNGSGRFNGGDIGRRILRTRDTRNWNWNATLTFDKSFKKGHNFDAILGIETRGEKSERSFIRGDNFADFTSPQPIRTAEEIDERYDSAEQYGRSGFTQLNYNFNKKYFLLVNFRVDQSSAFGGDNDTALNGGLGTSWVASNEKFLSDTDFIDFLRLRASYGTTGNSRIGSYRALGLYQFNFNGYNGIDYVNPVGTAPNPNLGWERNNKFNLGIDFNFKSNYKLTLEVFRDLIQEAIVSRPAIPESGYSNIQINGASMVNSGIELSFNADWIRNENFSWSTNFNAATLRNEVTALSGIGSDFSAAERARAQQVGFPTSTIWGFESLGIDPATGRELFNVAGNTYDAQYVRENFTNADWTPIGDTQPDVYGGMRNNFKYKNFNLGVIMSYTFGGEQIIDRSIIDNYNVFFNRNLNLNAFYESWREPGDLAGYPALSNSNPIVSNSSRYLYDTSNLQLKSVSLSYNLPVRNWKIPLKTCTVNMNGSNLFYWFMEPGESGRNGIAEFRNVYPQMRTFSVGINTTF
jgi:TonB-linked SusC/RagA family outer membrane protein